MPCYLLKSRKAHAVLGEYRVFNAVNLKKMKDEIPQLYTFNELSRSSPVKFSENKLTLVII